MAPVLHGSQLEPHQQRGPFWTPITPQTGSFFHAETQHERHDGGSGDDLRDWIVTDDWPEHIPVSEAEVDLFERWFGDFFDELFGTKQ